MLLVVIVSLSCFTVTIILDLKHSEDKSYYTEEGRHFNLRWMLSLDKKDVHNNDQYKRMIRSKTKYPIVSQPYKINNKNICNGVEKVSVIVMVHTAPRHFLTRLRMRATWLNSTYYSPENVRVVFLLGSVFDPMLQYQIEEENKKFKDIVQGQFIDSYRNLTNKGVMGYKWISKNCMNAEIVLKVDDDAFVNFFKYFEEMSHIKEKKKYILCNRILKGTMGIIRVTGSKWYVNEDEFRNMKAYPHTYCSGFSVFISTDLIPMLYQAAIGSPFFWVDDFFLFGLLPSRVPGVVHDNLRSNLSFIHPAAYDCYIRYRKKCKYMIVPAKEKEIPKMWLAVVQDRIQSIFGNYYMDLPSLPERSTPMPTSYHLL